MVLSARAAVALRDGSQGIVEAQGKAEAGYKNRIDELERHRLPDPTQFQANQMAKVQGDLQAHADGIGEAAINLMRSGVDDVENQWVAAIHACSDKDQVKATVAALGAQGQSAMAQVMADVNEAVAAWSGESIRELEEPLLAELRNRYQIVQQITGSGKAVHLGGDAAASIGAHATNLQAGVAAAIENFEAEQFAFGAGGALAGAAIGTVIFPGVGTVIGAAVGAFAGLFKTLDSPKADCVKEVRKGLGDAKGNLASQLSSVAPHVQNVMREVLAKGLKKSVARFQSWITKIMAAELKQIDRERQMLSHLTRSRDALVQHDQTLQVLQREAAAVSQGLCG